MLPFTQVEGFHKLPGLGGNVLKHLGPLSMTMKWQPFPLAF